MKRGKIALFLMVIGLALATVGFMQQGEENTILEVGDITIEKSREHNVNWMLIGGAALVGVGILVYLVPARLKGQ